MDIKRAGAYLYAAHPSTDIWCLAYAFDDEPVQLWKPGDPVPPRITEHVLRAGKIRAHNAAFERLIWRHILHPRYFFPPARLEQFVCSAAEAAAMSLPRSLGALAAVLGTSEQKDDEGRRVMLQVSRPREVRDDGTVRWWRPEDARNAKDAAACQEKLDRLYSYCMQDVDAERAVEKKLRRLTHKERALYLLDQRVNDRGVRIDRPLVVAAREMTQRSLLLASEELAVVTGGAVSSVTNHGRLAGWVRSRGVDAPGVNKAAVVELLGADLPADVRAALEIRADAGRSSVAKLDAMLDAAGGDDRLRGLLLFHAASTGRWAGRLVQPQNFPRGEVDDVEAFIPDILAGRDGAVAVIEHPIKVISSLLRGMLVPSPGCRFFAGDFSAIEARVVNWIAGQDDVLADFRAYDAGDKSRDPYVQNAMRLFGLPYEKIEKFPHRQTGKFQELACGFGMGAKKGVTAAKTIYGLDVTEERMKDIVAGYRESHDRVRRLWWNAEGAILTAVERPGKPTAFGVRDVCKVMSTGSHLWIGLPYGRALCYPQPSVVEVATPWGDIKPQVEVAGENPLTHAWGRNRLYGGLLTENVTQALARDVMAEAMFRLENAGIPVVLDVHDEIVCEVPNDDPLTEHAFQKIMSTPPAWAADLPVAVETWVGNRYRK